MSDDRVGKLLERVAREMTEQIRVNGTVFLSGGLESWNPPSPGKVAELSAKLLEARLGPLLRAGQAMRDELNAGHLGHTRSCTFDSTDSPEGDYCTCGLSERRTVKGRLLGDYNAALAALEGRDGK